MIYLSHLFQNLFSKSLDETRKKKKKIIIKKLLSKLYNTRFSLLVMNLFLERFLIILDVIIYLIIKSIEKQEDKNFFYLKFSYSRLLYSKLEL